MRGRPQNNNNRRGPNPLTRSYESNGPDVKIRGNAHHIAEKYLQLARDAHTSGDPVAAENYLQHAEHYFRLIATAQAAQAAAQGRPPGEPEPEDIDDEDDGGVLDRFASPPERAPPYSPQPQPFAPQPQPQAYGYNNDRQPFDGERPPQGERNNYQGERNNFQPRNDRPQHNRIDNRPPRPPYQERDNGSREHRGPQDNRPYQDNRGQENRGQDNRGPREFRNFRDNPRPEPQPALAEPAAGLPSFITAAPRTPIPAESLDAPQPVIDAAVPAPAAPAPAPVEAAAEPVGDDADARAPRGRRRRLRSPYGFHAGEEAPVPPSDGPASE